jgi:hypothetical protein
MRWRKKKHEAKPQRHDGSEARTYDEAATNRLRGIGAIGNGYTEEDAAAVEARLRNMAYGTNRE